MHPMRPRARTVVALAALATLPALGSSCGGGGSGAVTVELWAMGREGEVVQQLMPEFERLHPGIRVDVQQIPWTAAHEKLLTAHVGDASPDVAQLGNTWIAELVTLDALEPLDSLIAASAVVDSADFFPGIWATNVLDSTLYGIPWYVDTRVLFYRSDILAEAGYATPPTTWGGWLDAMRRIKAGMGAGEYPIFIPLNEWQPPVILGLQTGSGILRDGGRYGDFRSPEYRRALEFFERLFDEGLAPRVSHTQVANVYQEFARGRFAMYITGPWNIGEFSRRLPEEVEDHWMTAPLPGPDGLGASVAGGSSLVLFSSSEHMAEAWALIEWLSAPEQQIEFYRLTGDLPTRESAWNRPVLDTNVYARAFRQQLERVVPTPEVPEWEQIATRIMEYAERVAYGAASVDEALQGLDRDVDRMLEKRRWMLAREDRDDER